MIGMLSSIDPNTMVLGLLFVIFFAIINFALYKSLRSKGTAGIIAFCISLLSVYGISRTGFDVSGIVNSIGISEEMIYNVVPFIILAGLIFMIWKLKLSRTFILVGIALIIGSFFVYEKTIVFIIGIVLLVIGLILLLIGKRRNRDSPDSKKKDNLNPNNSNEAERRRQQGIDALIKAAKRFKSWAQSQQNPRFVGSWAYFINYLKQGRWGNSEAEICQRLGITQNDFVNIFNRYGKV
jgi:preprotein translocase subunit YajC